MPFDYEAARAEGYTDDEIAQHVSQQRGFDFEGAKTEGYSGAEIIEFFRSADPAAQPLTTDTAVEAVDTAVEVAPEPPTDQEDGWPQPINQLTGSFWDAVTGENPKMFYRTLEGLGHVTGSDTLRDFGKRNADEEEENPEKFHRRVHSYTEIFDDDTFGKNVSDAVDYVASSVGQGVGSMTAIF